MKFISKIVTGFSDKNLKPTVTFELDEIKEDIQEIPSDELVQVEIKRITKKRSLNANNYYWTVVHKISEKIGSTNQDIHLMLLKRYSYPDLITVQKGVDISKYIKYFETLYEGENEIEYLIYKGSSDMTSKEFNRLLQGAIDEAESLGLTILSLQEVLTLGGKV